MRTRRYRKRHARTDAEVVRIAMLIDRLGIQINDLIDDIRYGEHPFAEEHYQAFIDNSIPWVSWASHVVHEYLQEPDRWESGDWGIRRRKDR